MRVARGRSLHRLHSRETGRWASTVRCCAQYINISVKSPLGERCYCLQQPPEIPSLETTSPSGQIAKTPRLGQQRYPRQQPVAGRSWALSPPQTSGHSVCFWSSRLCKRDNCRIHRAWHEQTSSGGRYTIHSWLQPPSVRSCPFLSPSYRHSLPIHYSRARPPSDPPLAKEIPDGAWPQTPLSRPVSRVERGLSTVDMVQARGTRHHRFNLTRATC
jgi:hypothetical protein